MIVKVKKLKNLNKQYIKFLAKQLDRDKLIIFVGAGVSMNSGLPNWEQLVEPMVKELDLGEEGINQEDILKIPEMYYKTFEKNYYYECLNEIFSGVYFPNDIHKELKEMNLPCVITTNYDTLLEEELNEAYDYDVIKRDEDLAQSTKTKMIIKMHGDLQNRNIVLKESDYKVYEKTFPLISNFIKGLFTTNTILFIGYSLNDPNVKSSLKWIKDILKDDTKKAYLVDFKSDNDFMKRDEDSQITRIVLPDMYRDDYRGKIDEDLLKDKGKLLKDFLYDINEERKKLVKKEKVEIYQKLSYPAFDNLKLFIKNLGDRIYILGDDLLFDSLQVITRPLKVEEEKVIKAEITEKSELERLIKFGVFYVNNDKIIDEYQHKELIERQKIYDNLLRIILEYDKKAFEEYLNDNLWLRKEDITVSGYMFFKDYESAKVLLEESLKNYRRNNDKEKIMWTQYLLYGVKNKIKKRPYLYFEDIEKLKKEYRKYFKKETELYEEIFEQKTLKKIKNKLKYYLMELKNSTNSFYNVKKAKFEEMKFLTRDLYKFIFFNGIDFSNDTVQESITFYVEARVILYKQICEGKKKQQRLNIKSTTENDKLKSFTYIDFFTMFQVLDSNLNNILIKNSIKILSCNLITIKKILSILDNIIDIEDFNYLVEKIMAIFVRLKLTEEDFNEFLNIILSSKFISKLSKYCFFQHYFLDALKNNKKYLNKDHFKKIILKILENKENLISVIFKGIVNLYRETNGKTIEYDCELQKLLDGHKLCIRAYLLPVLESTNYEFDFILKELKNKFNLEIYTILRMLSDDIKIKKLENNIPNFLTKIFIKEWRFSTEYNTVIRNLFLLLEKGKISVKMRKILKDYNNLIFINYLKIRDVENIFNYKLQPDKFDYNKFSLSDLEKINSEEVFEILNKKGKNGELLKKVKDYVELKLEKDIILKNYIALCRDLG